MLSSRPAAYAFTIVFNDNIGQGALRGIFVFRSFQAKEQIPGWKAITLEDLPDLFQFLK